MDLKHLPTDQVFSYYHTDKMLHFNVSLLSRMHKAIGTKAFRRITMDITEDMYRLCMEHRGIEEPKVEALQGKSLREPGYAVIFDDNDFTIVDGHHRLVRRWRGGVRQMDFWVTPPPVWQQCLVHYSPEFEQFLQQGMPAKVENPESFSSRVKLHRP